MCTFTSSRDDEIAELGRALGRKPSKRITRQLEQNIQRAVFDHLRSRARPNVFAFHCPNGGKRSRVEAAILKGLGVVAGVPDVIILHNGRLFAIELKASGGRATAAQMECVSKINACGGFAAICTGLDSALRCLEIWGILKGRTT